MILNSVALLCLINELTDRKDDIAPSIFACLSLLQYIRQSDLWCCQSSSNVWVFHLIHVISSSQSYHSALRMWAISCPVYYWTLSSYKLSPTISSQVYRVKTIIRTTITQRMLSRLQVFIDNCQQKIINIHQPDRISTNELWKKTGKEPVQEQLWRRCNWLGHILKSDDSIAKQALQWTTQGHGWIGWCNKHLKKDLHKELCTADLRYSCRKMRRWQQNTELNEDKWSVADVALAETVINQVQ